jgi:uncharacterized linocin/CFP29 family protein
LLTSAGESPPYTLVYGPAVFGALDRVVGAYPIRQQIASLIGGELILAPCIEGAFLLPSQNADDFEMVLGHDASVGFEVQEGQSVRLYMTESFTFRVLEPQAVVAFEIGR